LSKDEEVFSKSVSHDRPENNGPEKYIHSYSNSYMGPEAYWVKRLEIVNRALI